MMRELLKKESMARLRVVYTNTPRIQSLIDEAGRRLLLLKAELQDQEAKLAKIVTKELLQFGDISEQTDALAAREQTLAARKAALEAELARVNEELTSVRQQLKACTTQRDASMHAQAEEAAKRSVERTKERMASQKLFTQALESCFGTHRTHTHTHPHFTFALSTHHILPRL